MTASKMTLLAPCRVADFFVLMLTTVLPLRALCQGLFEQALEESDKVETGAASESGPLDLGGYVRGALFLGKMQDEDSSEFKSGYGELALTLKARLGGSGQAFAELRSRYGYDGADTRLANDLREAYVDLFMGPVDLRLGHQIITWGRADGINPTNNLTPRDMSFRSPVEDDTRSANLALRTNLYLGPTRTEVVWVPFYSPSRYPTFKLEGPVDFGEPVYPDKRFEDGTFAARVNLELPEVEGSVSYLFGYSPLPGLLLGSMTTTDGTPAVEVLFKAYKHHVAGMDFAVAPGGMLGVRGEAALKWPQDYEDNQFSPFPEVQYVLGADKEWSDVYVIVQYVGKLVIDHDMPEDTGLIDLAQGRSIPPEKLADIIRDPEGAAKKEVRRKLLTLSGQTEAVQHGLMARIQYKALQETLTLELAVMYNFSTGEYMVRPKVSYDVADGLEACVGGEVYGGPDDTLFGMIDEAMSAGFLEVRAWF